jgi:hypothetical protein
VLNLAEVDLIHTQVSQVKACHLLLEFIKEVTGASIAPACTGLLAHCKELTIRTSNPNPNLSGVASRLRERLALFVIQIQLRNRCVAHGA